MDRQPKLVYRTADLIKALGMSRSTIWRLAKSGKFPMPKRIGKASVWLVADVDQWLMKLPDAYETRLPDHWMKQN